jgi:CRP-like cAMP-binding protein
MNIFARTNDDDLLKYLNEEERISIAPASEIMTFQPGEVIVTAGDRTRDLFIIRKGSASVVLSDDHEKMVFELTERDLIGEINFVLPVRRSATVKALTELVAIRYDYNKTMAFLNDNLVMAAKVFAALNDILAGKLIKTTQRHKNMVSLEADNN